MDSFDGWPDVITALRSTDPARPAPPATGTVIVFSGSELICEGVIGLLPKEWRDRIVLAADVSILERRLDGQRASVIIDAGSDDAGDAVRATAKHGGSTILLLGSDEHAVDSQALALADAIVRRDEAEPLMLRTALAAGRLGMRLVPRSLDGGRGGTPVAGGIELSEMTTRALALLAAGRRDAEIARELSLSESAVRKLVQRAVRSLGARTRCQAIAIVARGGGL